MVTGLFFNIVTLGCIYVLAALGFVFLLNAARSINFAYGELLLASGLINAWLLPINKSLTLLLVPAVILGIGIVLVVLSFIFYWPLRNRPIETIFLSSIGLGLIIQNLLVLFLGTAPVQLRLFVDPYFELWNILIPKLLLWLAPITTFTVLVLFCFLHFTKTGLRLQASVQNPLLAAIYGIRLETTTIICFLIAGCLIATAGLFLSQQYYLSGDQGNDLLLKTYILTIIGGWGRLSGLIFGALLLGFLDVLLAFIFSYPLASIIIYGLLLVLMLLRPKGLIQDIQGQRV